MNSGKVIIIGGSTGGVKVLSFIIPKLPKGFSIPIVIVLHRKQGSENLLESILQDKSKLDVVEAEDKIKLVPGVVYIAPCDYHLFFEKEHTISLDVSERVLYSRPSINIAMKSAADEYGKGTIGILLTGANEDGALGMKAIMDKGGQTIIQDPKTSEASTMPLAAKNKTNGKVKDIPEIIQFLIQLNGQ